MPQINQLSSTDSLSAGDTLVVYVNSNGDTRKASMSTITEYIESNITLGKPEFVKQKVSPSATGQTIQINDNSNNTWLVSTPTGAFAAMTIKFPAIGNCVDKQEILITTTQAVTTLTWDINGATDVVGEPASFTTPDNVKFKLDLDTRTWYKVA